MRILIREGADPKVLGHFYKAVAQAVLMFGSETWVIALRMERSLVSFHHRVTQRITWRQPRRRGEWKTVSMVCRPFQVAGNKSEAA